MAERRLSGQQYAWIFGRGGSILGLTVENLSPAAGRRSPPLEFVDDACILNTHNPIGLSFQRPQIIPHLESENRGLCKQFSARYLKTESVFSDDQKVCVVCQDNDVRHGERVGILDCNHEYHVSCIKVWLREKNTCPLCNATAL